MEIEVLQGAVDVLQKRGACTRRNKVGASGAPTFLSLITHIKLVSRSIDFTCARLLPLASPLPHLDLEATGGRSHIPRKAVALIC